MEYAIEYPKEEKIKRRDERIWLSNSYFYMKYVNGQLREWSLEVSKDERKRPTLENDDDFFDNFLNDEKCLKKHIEYIITFLSHYDELCQQNKMDEFIQDEFLKVVYDHIKLELVYNRYESKLLNFIIENNFKINEFNNMVKRDIEEINRSTYGNLTFIEYLNTSIKLNDLLSREVIRNIVMCTNYDLIKNTSKNRLKTNSKKTRNALDKIRASLKTTLTYTKDEIRENRKKYKRAIIKRNIAISLILCTILGTGCVVKKQTDNYIETETPPKFKTTYTTYSNISNTSVTEDYSEKINDYSPILKIYSKAYQENGVLYRDITTYKVEDFIDTSDLEKYYNYDFSIVKPTDIDSKVVVKSDEPKEEYREVLKIYQDKTDAIHNMSKLEYMFYLIIPTIFISAIPVYMEAFYISIVNERIYEINRKCYPSFVEAQRLITKLKESGEDIGKFLKESVLLCDELIGSEDISSLSEECQSLIKEYENFRNEHAELLEQITNDEINEYIKKYEKKMR